MQLLRTIGAAVYVLGHPSPNDGRRHRGTGQTPGVPDLIAFLPSPVGVGSVLLFVECKAAGGTLSEAQRAFQWLCHVAEIGHVVGDLTAVIAWCLKAGYLKPEHVPHYRLPKEHRA